MPKRKDSKHKEAEEIGKEDIRNIPDWDDEDEKIDDVITVVEVEPPEEPTNSYMEEVLGSMKVIRH